LKLKVLEQKNRERMDQSLEENHFLLLMVVGWRHGSNFRWTSIAQGSREEEEDRIGMKEVNKSVNPILL